MKMILRDSYNFRKTGFLATRLLSPSYKAAHYLQTVKHYRAFNVYLEWEDEFKGNFDRSDYEFWFPWGGKKL